MSIRLKIILPYLALTIFLAILGIFMMTRLTSGILESGGLRLYVLFIVVVLLSVTAVGYVVAQIILKPLNSLLHSITKVADGDLKQRTNLHTKDEVGALAGTFDKMAAQLEQRIYELEQTNRVLEQLDQTKNRFVSVTAHELRTPLTLLTGYSSMMTEKMKLNDPQISRYAQAISQGADRMREIIDSMLDLSRIDTSQLELMPADVEISLVIERVEKTFASALQERNISLVTTGLSDLPLIHADKGLLYKVFYHVVGNAIKYTPDGGSIAVNGRLIQHSPQGEIEVTIRDTGIGIDPSHLDLIFEKFYQTGEVLLHSSGKVKFKGGGPGLGLAIARGIINAHGGQIWAESSGYDEQDFPGSTFYIRLPEAAQESE